MDIVLSDKSMELIMSSIVFLKLSMPLEHVMEISKLAAWVETSISSPFGTGLLSGEMAFLILLAVVGESNRSILVALTLINT